MPGSNAFETLKHENIKYLNLIVSVKILTCPIFVIPVKTGIQYFETVAIRLDSRLRGNDDMSTFEFFTSPLMMNVD